MNFLDHFSIKSRIILLFTLLLLFFVAFGLYTIQKTEIIGGLTRTSYNHSFQVSNAALRVESGILKMHRGMKDIAMAQSQKGVILAIHTVETEEENVYRELAIVKELILGSEGEALIKQIIEMFSGWKLIRVEVENLVSAGDMVAAGIITRHKGADYVSKLERQIKTLNNYARRKADGFMDTADKTLEQMDRIIIWGIGIVSAVGLFFSFLIISSITGSLQLLKEKMSHITSSLQMSSIELPGKNEMTELAAHFNMLVLMIRDQLWLRNTIERINAELIGDSSLEEMTQRCIQLVCRSIDASAGAFYLFDKGTDTCTLSSSFALAEGVHFSRSFGKGEGIIGQVANEKKEVFLQNITCTDTCIKSAVFSMVPTCIYAVPLVYNNTLLAVLEVALMEQLDEVKKQFMDEAAVVIASLLSNALQSQQVETLLAESQAANASLKTKTDEINAQNKELGSINNELQAQATELQAQRDELQKQAQTLEKKQVQVEAADKLKSEFLSNMSHELRTPLNSIMSLSQLLISRGIDKDPEKSIEYLEVIDRNGRQLLHLINDILDLTKIESGRMEIFATTWTVASLVQRVMETMAPLAGKKGLRFNKNIKKNAHLFTDEDKVYQILLNFCSNAIKFTDTGTVGLDVGEQDGVFSFSIRDTGIGIPSEKLGIIFDEFRQVDGSSSRDHEGTGLGLAISKKLAFILGGQVTVKSELGAGSTFTLHLPAHCSDVELSDQLPNSTSNHMKFAADAVIEDNIPAIAGHPQRILVIEDNKIANEQIVGVLQEHGFEVVSAKNGEEGLAHVQQNIPDAIVLDLMMPKIDGFEVLEQIRSKPETVTLPVLILTAKEISAAERSKLANNNIQQMIQKGTVDREQLVASVSRMLVNVPNVPTRPLPNNRTSKAQTILLVEDNSDNQITAMAILEEGGYEVLVAEDGKQGAKIVKEKMPDLVLMDIHLPIMSGIEVIKLMRSDPATDTIPVIALTASAMVGDKENLLAQGANDYISKPINPVELQKKVRQWLG